MKRQMRKQNGKRRGSGYVLTALIFAAVLTACGGSGQSGQESSASSGTEQESAEPSSQTAEDENASLTESSSQAEESTAGNEGTAVPDNAAVPEKESGAEADKADVQTAAPAADGEHAVAELSGDIETIGTGSFVVNQVFTETADDGSMIAYSSQDNKTLLNIAYDDQTVFTICTSNDGGMTSANTPGSQADLEIGRSTLMNGYWEGDTFHAQEIIIYHFG